MYLSVSVPLSGSSQSPPFRALYRLFVYVWMAVGLAWLSLLIGVMRDGFQYIAETNRTKTETTESNNTFAHNHPVNFESVNVVSINHP